MILEPIADAPISSQADVTRSVVAVQNIDASLVAKVGEAHTRPVVAAPTEHSPTNTRTRIPLDLGCAPEQAVSTHEHRRIMS